MQLAYQMAREEQRLFDSSSRELIQESRGMEQEELVRYIRGLRDWAIGNLITYQNHPRYTIANRQAAARPLI